MSDPDKQVVELLNAIYKKSDESRSEEEKENEPKKPDFRIDTSDESKSQEDDPPTDDQLRNLREDINRQFERTRREFAKSVEMERLQEENRQLKRESEALQRSLDRIGYREDDQEVDTPSDPTSASTREAGLERSRHVNKMQIDKHTGVIAAQVLFLAAGIGSALTPFVGDLIPWPQAIVFTTPLWLVLVFVFVNVERHLIAEQAEAI